MLRVKTIYGGVGGGADNSIWAETWYPERGVRKPSGLYAGCYGADHDIGIHANVRITDNSVLPEVLNTDTVATANPFFKAVSGYTSVT